MTSRTVFLVLGDLLELDGITFALGLALGLVLGLSFDLLGLEGVLRTLITFFLRYDCLEMVLRQELIFGTKLTQNRRLLTVPLFATHDED